jgi:hypothetical protein
MRVLVVGVVVRVLVGGVVVRFLVGGVVVRVLVGVVEPALANGTMVRISTAATTDARSRSEPVAVVR